MARRTPPPYPPESVSIKALRGRLAEISDPAAIRALADADTRSSAVREYERRLEEIAAEASAPAHPNPVVEAKPAHPTKPDPTRRAYPNPRISAATVRIAGRPEPVEVTSANRETIEAATVTLDGRTLPLFEIRG
jgi:hypothetical protein